jgi:hypothetical protein
MTEDLTPIPTPAAPPLTEAEKSQFKEAFAKTKPEEKITRKLKWPFKAWGKVKKAEKKPDQINVIYLNQKLGIEILQTKIYGGNFLVVREKVYRFAASAVWRYKNYSFVIAKEWDRNLVGRSDYDAVVSQGSRRSPMNDPVLIKALIQAKLAEKKQISTNWIIWVILGIIGLAAAFFIFGGGGNPADVGVATAPAA